MKVGLRFDPDGKPYPQHANIFGWHDPGGVPDSEIKHFWMEQAQTNPTLFFRSSRRAPVLLRRAGKSSHYFHDAVRIELLDALTGVAKDFRQHLLGMLADMERR